MQSMLQRSRSVMEAELLPGLEKRYRAGRVDALHAIEFHAVELLANILKIVKDAASITVPLSRSVILRPPSLECLDQVNLRLLDLALDLIDDAPLLRVLVELLSVSLFLLAELLLAYPLIVVDDAIATTPCCPDRPVQLSLRCVDFALCRVHLLSKVRKGALGILQISLKLLEAALNLAALLLRFLEGYEQFLLLRLRSHRLGLSRLFRRVGFLDAFIVSFRRSVVFPRKPERKSRIATRFLNADSSLFLGGQILSCRISAVAAIAIVAGAAHSSPLTELLLALLVRILEHLKHELVVANRGCIGAEGLRIDVGIATQILLDFLVV